MNLTKEELAEEIWEGLGRFPNMQSCEKAAERILAKLDEPEPVIEVGDIVNTHKDGEFETKVLGVDLNPIECACVQFPDGSMSLENLKDLILIRKGPKACKECGREL
jgi:hypothetical protein